MDGREVWNLKLKGGRCLILDHFPRVMAVLNITPDSFSDGGLALDPQRAVDRAMELVDDGADILDLGAESTRPGGGVYGGGAQKVSVQEELDRLLPVLSSIRALTDRPISVDTRKAEVAKAALEAGADLINNVGGHDDEALHREAKRAQAPVIVMHSRGDLASMQHQVHYDNVLTEVRADLEEQVAAAERQGVPRDHIIIDPGIGFGKDLQHNLALLRGLPVLAALGLPLLVGASRKSFIGELTGDPPTDRLEGSLAAAAWAARHKAALVRVHDVRETARFLRVYRAISEANGAQP